MKKAVIASLILLVTLSGHAQKLSKEERTLIKAGAKGSMMRVLQVTEAADLKILKSVSKDVVASDEAVPLLIDRMYATVRDTANPGVGIAAPQIGINRNIIWVQRFDKEGEPFEAYLNPKIIWSSKLLRKGTEGCLSIADVRGDALRNYTIRITYLDRNGKAHEEMVEGFTAVIFQHEIDHLNGILFTDRLSDQKRQQYSLINPEVHLYLETRLKRQ